MFKLLPILTDACLFISFRCGSIGPIREICALARKYNALTFLDEVHAVGMYGDTGAGVADLLPGTVDSSVMDEVDIVSGTLGKAYGVVGGYVAGSHRFVGHSFVSLLCSLRSELKSQ